MNSSTNIYKHNLDFLILDCISNNLKEIIIKDNSEYGWELERLYLEILFLGYTDLKSIIFNHDDINVLTTNKLGVTDCNNIDFEDGLYWITYSVSPHDYVFVTKLYLRTKKYDCLYSSLLLEISYTNFSVKEDEDVKNKLIDLSIMKEAAIANIENGNIEKGTDLFRRLVLDLNKISNKIKGTCNN